MTNLLRLVLVTAPMLLNASANQVGSAGDANRRFLQTDNDDDGGDTMIEACRCDLDGKCVDERLNVLDSTVRLCLVSTHDIGPIKDFVVAHGRAYAIEYVNTYVKLNLNKVAPNLSIFTTRDFGSANTLEITVLLPQDRLHLFTRALIAIIFRKVTICGEMDIVMAGSDDVIQADFTTTFPAEPFRIMKSWVDDENPYLYMIYWGVVVSAFFVLRLCFAALLWGCCCCCSCRKLPCWRKNEPAETVGERYGIHDEEADIPDDAEEHELEADKQQEPLEGDLETGQSQAPLEDDLEAKKQQDL